MTLKKVRLREKKVASRHCARLFGKETRSRVGRAINNTQPVRDDHRKRKLPIRNSCLETDITLLNVSAPKNIPCVVAQKSHWLEKPPDNFTTDYSW